MNHLPADTTIQTKFNSTLITIIDDVSEPIIIVNSRAQSTPVARKRRMMEQPSLNTKKNPKRDPGSFGTIKRVTNNQIEPEKNNKIIQKPPMHPDLPRKRIIELNKRDDSTKLRKTIQWLENGAKKLRDDLAEVRSELHEERRVTRILKQNFSNNIRDARNNEKTKYRKIIADLKIKLLNTMQDNNNQIQIDYDKVHLIKNENNKKNIIAVRKRLNEQIISIDYHNNTLKRRKMDQSDLKKIDNDIQNSRQINKRLGDKHQMVTDAKQFHEVKHCLKNEKQKAEICKLKKGHSETIKMMRKLRDIEHSSQVHLESYTKNSYKNGCEIDHLRELAVEQQEIIEYLCQALKERERKLDQLENKKRKEEFYKKWLELETVAEVDDEDEHEDHNNTQLSCSQWQKNTLTRKSNDNLIIEFEELQKKYIEEKEKLLNANNKIKDLEKVLNQNNHNLLTDKLKKAEERELNLLAELSDIREQNELLEFRILELEETGGSRETSDTADSGIVSPELIYNIQQINQNNKQQQQQQQQQQRAIATVIPYNNNNKNNNYYNDNDYHNDMIKLLSTSSQKSTLSLQESGIFDDNDDDYNENIEFTNCSTQTETPSCELLQEVGRLQQLREKIQERAVKVPVQVDNTLEIIEDNNKSLFFKNRIKELEERLEIYKIADIERSREKTIAKQREDELLDENYRLTERVYWLEIEIHNYQKNHKTDEDIFINKFSNTHDIGTCTDVEIEVIDCLDCRNLKKDYHDIVEKFSQAQCSFKKKLIDFEKKEINFEKRYDEVNANWNQRECHYNIELKKMQDIIIEKEVKIISLIKKIDELEKFPQPMDTDGNFERIKFSKHTQTLINDEQTNLSNIKVANAVEDLVNLVESQKINQIIIGNGEIFENKLLKKNESKALEKVRKRWKCQSEEEGWAMKVSKIWQNNNRNNRRSIIDKHRLKLYSEICV